eukprot:scaffold87022_cov19-Tisochrysis_lutea.AAC.1
MSKNRVATHHVIIGFLFFNLIYCHPLPGLNAEEEGETFLTIPTTEPTVPKSDKHGPDRLNSLFHLRIVQRTVYRNGTALNGMLPCTAGAAAHIPALCKS